MAFFTETLLSVVAACGGGARTGVKTTFWATFSVGGDGHGFGAARTVGDYHAPPLQNIQAGIGRAHINAIHIGHAGKVAGRALLGSEAADDAQQRLLTIGNVPHVNILCDLARPTYGTKKLHRVVEFFWWGGLTKSVSGARSEAKRIRWTQGWAVAIPFASRLPEPTLTIADTGFSHARPAACSRNFLSSAK